MRWILALGVAALLLFGCGNKGAVDDAIERSTAPLLVPADEWRRAFDFTAPPGSTDLYQMRWNFEAGATDIVSGWQVGPKSVSDPGDDIAGEVLRAAADEGCVRVDQEFGIRMCSYPAEFARGGANVYLVREVGERNLVVEYLNIDGDRNEYNPAALSVRFITAEFEVVSIDGDISDYLVYIY